MKRLRRVAFAPRVVFLPISSLVRGSRGRVPTAALFLGLLFGLASPSWAADVVFDARGFNQNRDYFSQLPYEHIDPMTGNLLLTYTDLVLPGNAGFDLRIQRTYNSKIYLDYHSRGGLLGEDSWAGLGWTLHLGRVLNPTPVPPNPGPIIEMPDGSLHPTFLRIGGPGFVSRDYWIYEAFPAPVLKLPNGVTYRFGHAANIGGGTVLYATEIRDPFGNEIRVRYFSGGLEPPDGIQSIEQRLVFGVVSQIRTVTFTFESGGLSLRALRTMTFMGRTWTYTQAPVPEIGYNLLTGVSPPIGPSWTFGYNTTTLPKYELISVTSPHGGRITYAYADQLLKLGNFWDRRTRAVTRRETSGRDIPAGVWTYAYAQGLQENQSVVTSPPQCGGGWTTTYTFLGIGNFSGNFPVWKIGLLESKRISEGAVTLEEELFVWIRSEPISNVSQTVNGQQDPNIWVPLVGTREVVRGGRSYLTTNTYGTANFSDFGRPHRTEETGELLRVTQRTFRYGFTPYIVDRVESETVTVDGEPFTRSYTYNLASGFTTSQTIYGIPTNYAQHASGNVRTMTDARGNQTFYDYDWGLVSRIQTPEYTIRRQINEEGTVASETRRERFTTAFQYDSVFRLTQTTPPVGNPVIRAYDNTGGTFAQVRRGSSVVTTSLDGFGRVSATANSVRIQTDISYDACDRTVYESYPFTATNIGTRYELDALGRTKRRINPDHTDILYTHTAGIDVELADEERRRTLQDWSAFGDPREARLVAVTAAAGTPLQQTTAYAYNALGNLRRVDPPGGAARVWVYNARNQLQSETHPENGMVSYTYDAVGNLQTRTDPEFGLTRFSYDRNSRLVTIDRPGSVHDTQIGYDQSDNRTLLRNWDVVSNFTYDGSNRLASRADRVNGRPFTAGYSYDSNDNISEIRYPSAGRAVYAYDTENRVTSVTDGGAVTFANDFAYHPSGGVTSYRAGNGLVHTMNYHPQRYWVQNLNVDQPAQPLLRLTYGYDNVGNVRTISDTRQGMNQSFEYDPVDRLTMANGFWGAGSFTYDAIGNRLTKSIGGATTTYTYNSVSNRLTSASAPEPASFTYDANGNIRGDGTGLYTYTPENLMERAIVGGVTTTYRYDGDNLRKLKLSGSNTRYFLHGPGNQILSELEQTGSGPLQPVRDYVYAGMRLLASVRPPVLIVNPSGLTFAAVVNGPAPAGQTFTVSNAAGTPLSWGATHLIPWLALFPSGGMTPSTVTVSVNQAGRSVGTYTGTITVTAPGALGSPRQILVRLIVTPEAALVVGPSDLNFAMVAGAGNPAPQALDILYSGVGSVSWQATTSAPWISLSATSGNTPSALAVSVDGAGFGEGTFRGWITVTSAGTPGSPRIVPVELVVQAPARGTCPPGFWYCEPFDTLNDGDIVGQAGWSSSRVPGLVGPDPRGPGKVLLLDPPPGGQINDMVAFADQPIDGRQISMQIMTEGVPLENRQIAKIEFFTIAGNAWGKTTRTFAALRFGSALYLQYGANIYQTLVDRLESRRWYAVKVVFQNGQIEAFVDGVLEFSTLNPLAPGLPVQAFATTGWDFPGAAYIDLIEGRPIPTGLVVEPRTLNFRASAGGGGVTLSSLSLSPSTVVGGNPSTGTVTLTVPAPPGGSVVTLSSSNAAVATVPASVPVLQGQTSATFEVTTFTVASSTMVNISGTLGATRMATLTVTPAGSVTLSVSPETIPAGQPVTATWAGIPTPTPTDWLGLYTASAPDTEPLATAYTDGSASGNMPFTIPSTVAPGTYELRLFANDSYTRLATSNTFEVTSSFGGLFRKDTLSLEARRGVAEPRRARARAREEASTARTTAGRHGGGSRGQISSASTNGVRRAVTQSAALPKADQANQIRVAEAYASLPMSFEANQGQADSRVKFLSRGSGYGLFLTSNECVLSLIKPAAPEARKGGSGNRKAKHAKAGRLAEAAVLRMKLKGANPSPQVVGLEGLPGTSNYFIGNDQKKWRTNVPNYRKVKYQDVYPGVDLVFYGREHQLEYDLIVAPGADPSAIRLGFEGAARLQIDSQGDLVLKTRNGEAYQRKPVIYQEVAGVRRSIDGHYVLSGKREVSFHVAAYDASRPLVIDPVFSYSTLLGGDPGDWAYSIAVDDDHNAYVTGVTRSARFPTANPLQANNAGGTDAFITKLNPEGSALLYSTYLGGDSSDHGNGIAVDSQDNVYVTGETSSTNFPRVGAVQNTFGGFYDAFVAKLNPSGSALVYSTYLGGIGGDRGFSVALDAQGNAYVAGDTGSASFPTSPPPIVFRANQDLGLAVSGDVFVTKLNPTGSVLVYLTYLNGESNDQVPAIAVDQGGSAYVTGWTHSTTLADRVGNPFPASVGAFQESHASPFSFFDAFVTKLNPAGSAVVFSTYLGGNSSDLVQDIALRPGCNADCEAYVAGFTASDTFPTTAGALWPTFGGGIDDAFVTSVNASGSALVYSTYLGRTEQDRAFGIAVDGSGGAYVTGFATSRSFPDGSCRVKVIFGPTGTGALITKLNPDGTALDYCAFISGTSFAGAQSIAIDALGDAYVTGIGGGADFPTTPNAFQRTGGNITFIAKISDPEAGGARLQFSSSSYSVIEDRGTAVIIVTRRGGTDGTVAVDYSTSDGTATAPNDYTATSGTLTFADRETAKAFTVPIVDDVLVEGDETVNLTLGNPTGGASLGFPSTAVLTILDDDGLSRTFVVRDRVLPTGPNWTASEDIAWLSLDAYSGVGPSTITATVNPGDRPVGTYTGTIIVTGDTGDSPQFVQVTLRITGS